MAGTYLLDTNAAIALMAEDKEFLEFIEDIDEIFVSVAVLGELYFGAENSERIKENLKRLERFAAAWTILDCNQTTAQHYGHIKRHVRKKGRPIPENDIWIAAIAMQHKLTLLTRDQHFNIIDGLSVETW